MCYFLNVKIFFFPSCIQAAYIHAAGYPSETHQVVTQDGYILQMHRIPRGPNSDPGRARTPVFIMHGLTATSSAYIAVGANLSIGEELLLKIY